MAMLIIVTAGLLYGCASPLAPVERGRGKPPQNYVVVRGDTLYGIAWRYGLDYKQIAAWNRLTTPDLIYPGQRLRLTPPKAEARPYTPPIAFQSRPQRPANTPPSAGEMQASSSTAVQSETGRAIPSPSVAPVPERVEPRRVSLPERRIGELVWRWPTHGEVVRDFKPDIPGRKGIHIGGELGQTVWAASSGHVVYSGSGLPGYGRLIIVKHSDVLLSAYGFLGKIYVDEGDFVELGQPIAEMGISSERRPALHFEIRQNGKPIDPLQFLPG